MLLLKVICPHGDEDHKVDEDGTVYCDTCIEVGYGAWREWEEEGRRE